MQVNPSQGRGTHKKVMLGVNVHCLVAVSNEGHGQKATKVSLGRKNCKFSYNLEKKQMKTLWQCSKCNIPLCLQLDGIFFHLFRCFQINLEPGIQYNIQNNDALYDNFGVTCQSKKELYELQSCLNLIAKCWSFFFGSKKASS